MKQVLFVVTCCLFLKASGQEVKNEFDGKKWEAPYIFDAPKGWDIERFLIPIVFAPSIQYKGVEDIRFTPGWSKKDTKEYWSYAFLWYLDSVQKFDSKIIEKNLIAYYTGLATINVDKSKVAADKIVTVKASLKKRKLEAPDAQTFDGTVEILDFLTLKPISLNLLIHIRYCRDQNKTFVFHEVSPQPYTDNVWQSLNQLWTNFRCTKE
jgi:hypothetical protein